MRLVLMDLDGTLVDSSHGIHTSVQVATTALGLPPPTPDQLNAMVGPPLQDGFAATFGLSGVGVDRAVAAYRTHYTAGAMFDATVYPGIADLLRLLRGRGAVLAVATSKPEEFAQQVLDHLGLSGCFASVHGSTLDGRVRHKEQVVGLALAAHPDGEEPVVVGDRAEDVIGARVHGMPCIGAGWGVGRPGELAEAGAAVVCATPDQVPVALTAVELRPLDPRR